MIDAAFERHLVAQINHDRSLRDVEKQNRKEPKKEVRLAEFCGCADPARADNEQNLCENEVGKAERFLERFTARFYLLLGALEVHGHAGKWYGKRLACPTTGQEDCRS